MNTNIWSTRVRAKAKRKANKRGSEKMELNKKSLDILQEHGIIENSDTIETCSGYITQYWFERLDRNGDQVNVSEREIISILSEEYKINTKYLESRNMWYAQGSSVFIGECAENKTRDNAILEIIQIIQANSDD